MGSLYSKNKKTPAEPHSLQEPYSQAEPHPPSYEPGMSESEIKFIIDDFCEEVHKQLKLGRSRFTQSDPRWNHGLTIINTNHIVLGDVIQRFKKLNYYVEISKVGEEWVLFGISYSLTGFWFNLQNFCTIEHQKFTEARF